MHADKHCQKPSKKNISFVQVISIAHVSYQLKIKQLKTEEERLGELISDDSFVTWIREGKPERSHWHKHYVRDDNYRLLVDEAEVIIKSMVIKPERIDIKTLDRIKNNIDRQIEAIPPSDTLHEKRLHIHYRWAAIIVFFVATIFAVKFFIDKSQKVNQDVISKVVKSTAKGQKLTIYLPDGSKVKINSNSKVWFDTYFKDTSRTVYLSGEAFFEVERDPTRPFTVISGDVVTKALGTSFNINSTQPDLVNITLATGKVLVAIKTQQDNKRSVYLSPGEQFVFNANRNVTHVHHVDLDEVLAWTKGKIIFREANGNLVFNKLSDWYGVNFQFEDNLLKNEWHYTGEFDNESLFNVLTSIGHVKKFSFQIEKDTVYIFQKD